MVQGHCSTRHVKASSDFRKGFLAVVAALDGFLLLVRGELWWPTHLHAVRLGALAAFGRAGAYQVAFELRQPA